jgi:hypothetical protein
MRPGDLGTPSVWLLFAVLGILCLTVPEVSEVYLATLLPLSILAPGWLGEYLGATRCQASLGLPGRNLWNLWNLDCSKN